MEALQKQYAELLASQRFREEDLDPALLERHIAALSTSPFLEGSAVSIFDLHRCEHVYESDFHKALFYDPKEGYVGVRIHPDDLLQVAKNGVAGMRHVFLRRNPNADVKSFKLIREYRALVHGAYKRVTEEFQILETDRAGNVWLVLSIVNLSANQQPPCKVTSQLIDIRTGDSFSPLDDFFDREEILSPREREVLQRIERGCPSKEIADELHISIHTVNTHRQRILAKLGVDNSLEAVKYAWILGILDD